MYYVFTKILKQKVGEGICNYIQRLCNFFPEGDFFNIYIQPAIYSYVPSSMTKFPLKWTDLIQPSIQDSKRSHVLSQKSFYGQVGQVTCLIK